jgi:hypothetical protein
MMLGKCRNYLLKIVNIRVKIILKIIDVAIGKKKVKLPFLIKISPGSLPIKGILSEAMNNKPKITITTPIKTSTFPISIGQF